MQICVTLYAATAANKGKVITENKRTGKAISRVQAYKLTRAAKQAIVTTKGKGVTTERWNKPLYKAILSYCLMTLRTATGRRLLAQKYVFVISEGKSVLKACCYVSDN